MVKENDIVLLYLENRPLAFARIEEFLPDIKPDWFHVKLLALQLPLKHVTWILKSAYIEGEEFTMDGKLMRIEKVVPPEDPEILAISPKNSIKKPVKKPGGKQKTPKNSGTAKIISFADIKKNQQTK